MKLLVVLAAAAGSLDIVCLTQLGSVFASVITGNLTTVTTRTGSDRIR